MGADSRDYFHVDRLGLRLSRVVACCFRGGASARPFSLTGVKQPLAADGAAPDDRLQRQRAASHPGERHCQKASGPCPDIRLRPPGSQKENRMDVPAGPIWSKR